MSKKEDIIRTALKLFNSDSYNSIGVDRIISESGVAKMTFYKYFPSKENLITECLIQRNRSLQKSISETLEKCHATDYLAQINAIFNWYAAWFNTDDFNGCMFQKALEEVVNIYPSIVQPATEYKIWLTQLIQDLLRGLNIQDPIPLAAFIVSILDGMTIQAHIDKEAVKIEEYWKRINHLIQVEQSLV